MNLKLVNKENLKEAINIQRQIFPFEDGKKNFITSVFGNKTRKEDLYWIAYEDSKIVGICGLYSYHNYPNDAWLGWYGVIEEDRRKGYGKLIFDFFENTALEKGYSNIRLYTDINENYDAIKFYFNRGMIAEKYNNIDETKEVTKSTLIFSKSLGENEISLWNDKYLELTEQLTKQNSNLDSFDGDGI